MSILFSIILMLGALSPASAAELEWKQLPDMPIEKWEAGTVVLDDKLYMMGGYTAGVKSSKISYTYAPKDGTWTRIQDLPSGISHMNMILDGRTIWYAGGYKDGYKGHCISEVWSYDIDNDRFTIAPILPEPRGGGGLAIVGRDMHFISGIKSDRDTDAFEHWVLNLDDWAKGSATWEDAAPIPDARNQFSCVVLNGKIYAIGGQYHHDKAQLDQSRTDIYDPKMDKWSAGPELPKGHSHAEGGTFVYKDTIYMVGGHTTPKGGTKSIDPDILMLKEGGEWELLGKLPYPLSSPAACIIDGKMYVGGGSKNGGSVAIELFVTDVPGVD